MSVKNWSRPVVEGASTKLPQRTSTTLTFEMTGPPQYWTWPWFDDVGWAAGLVFEGCAGGPNGTIWIGSGRGDVEVVWSWLAGPVASWWTPSPGFASVSLPPSPSIVACPQAWPAASKSMAPTKDKGLRQPICEGPFGFARILDVGLSSWPGKFLTSSKRLRPWTRRQEQASRPYARVWVWSRFF